MSLAEFLFARAAMTPRELIDNFGGKFGLTAPDDNPYLDEYYLNNVPLEQVWNNAALNDDLLDVESILGTIEGDLRNESKEPTSIGAEGVTGEPVSVEEKIE